MKISEFFHKKISFLFFINDNYFEFFRLITSTNIFFYHKKNLSLTSLLLTHPIHKLMNYAHLILPMDQLIILNNLKLIK